MMSDPLSGVAIIICIAFGVLTIVLLFIFANRQIKRFSLKSKYGPHMPIAQDAPKSLLTEINRRLDIIKNIQYQPPLLKKSDEIYFEEEYASQMPCHLYRMKALDSIPALDAAILSADPSKVRPYHQDYRVYLIRLAQSGLFCGIEMITIHKFADLYEAARHGPDEFNKEQYLLFIELMSQIQESLLHRSTICRQNTNKSVSSAVQSIDPEKIEKCKGPSKSSSVGSCQNIELAEEKKETYETSV